MFKIGLNVLAILAVFIFGEVSVALAHHEPFHNALVLKEQSKVSVRLWVCESKEDADSILIANEQGGADAAQRQSLFLANTPDENGNPRCGIVSGLATPLLVLRRTTITVLKGGVEVKTEGTLMQVWIVDEVVSKIYFSPTSAPVVQIGTGGKLPL